MTTGQPPRHRQTALARREISSACNGRSSLRAPPASPSSPGVRPPECPWWRRCWCRRLLHAARPAAVTCCASPRHWSGKAARIRGSRAGSRRQRGTAPRNRPSAAERGVDGEVAHGDLDGSLHCCGPIPRAPAHAPATPRAARLLPPRRPRSRWRPSPALHARLAPEAGAAGSSSPRAADCLARTKRHTVAPRQPQDAGRSATGKRIRPRINRPMRNVPARSAGHRRGTASRAVSTITRTAIKGTP